MRGFLLNEGSSAVKVLLDTRLRLELNFSAGCSGSESALLVDKQPLESDLSPKALLTLSFQVGFDEGHFGDLATVHVILAQAEHLALQLELGSEDLRIVHRGGRNRQRVLRVHEGAHLREAGQSSVV